MLASARLMKSYLKHAGLLAYMIRYSNFPTVCTKNIVLWLVLTAKQDIKPSWESEGCECIPDTCMNAQLILLENCLVVSSSGSPLPGPF